MAFDYYPVNIKPQLYFKSVWGSILITLYLTPIQTKSSSQVLKFHWKDIQNIYLSKYNYRWKWAIRSITPCLPLHTCLLGFCTLSEVGSWFTRHFRVLEVSSRGRGKRLLFRSVGSYWAGGNACGWGAESAGRGRDWWVGMGQYSLSRGVWWGSIIRVCNWRVRSQKLVNEHIIPSIFGSASVTKSSFTGCYIGAGPFTLSFSL